MRERKEKGDFSNRTTPFLRNCLSSFFILILLFSVTVLEANVLDLIEDGEELLGITFKRKDSEVVEVRHSISAFLLPMRESELNLFPKKIKSAHASLTIDCTGSFSKLRRKLTISQPTFKSHFVALLLKDCELPYPNYGYVTLVKPAPVLSYQIATNEVRVLVAVPDPLPSASKGELKRFLLETVLPQLPTFFHEPFTVAANEQLRSVPCRTMPTIAVRRPGAFCLGDALNMRHPLTGGGMTVAFTDISIVAKLLSPFSDLSDRRAVLDALEPFYQERRNPAGTINTLSQALYAVFCGGSADPALAPMTDGCFAYFPHFGSETLGILGGIYTNPWYLVMHFFAVAFFTMWQLMKPYPTPQKLVQAVRVLYAAFFVIKPLLTENFLIKPAHRFGEVQLLE